MKKVLGMLGAVVLLSACDQSGRGGSSQDTTTDGGYGYGSTNVGMKPGSGRLDEGGGVTEGDTPARVRSAVGTTGYEDPRTNIAGATNAPLR